MRTLPGKLDVGQVVADVLRVYARHWKLLVPMAVVILLPQALADAVGGPLEVEGVHSWHDVAILGAVPITVLASLGGEAFYAGLVAAVVLEWRSGHRAGLRPLARALPYRRLIGADVLISLGAALGLLLLVVPGLIFITFFFISPALIKLEGLTVRQSFRRSAELVRPNFWRVLIVGLTVVAGTEVIVQVAQVPLHHFLGDLGADVAVDAILEPFQGLMTVLVAIGLLELRGEMPESARIAHASP